MAQRVAFLIGNQNFLPESGLLPLQGPRNDVAALARVLGDPDRGRFEVHEFLDESASKILSIVEQALGAAGEEDFFLIFYSGHGKLAHNGQLYLATVDTRRNALHATSISARNLTDLVEDSYCGQVVLLLDCCYSGAVGNRGDVSSELEIVDNARGFYIITATTDMKSARETELRPGGAVMGRFTAALVNGIESGIADRERKGKILLSDLRHHLGRVVTGQTPQFFDRRASGDPLISHSPAAALPLLQAEVLAEAGDAATRASARVALQSHGTIEAAPRPAVNRRLEKMRQAFDKAAHQDKLQAKRASRFEAFPLIGLLVVVGGLGVSLFTPQSVSLVIFLLLASLFAFQEFVNDGVYPALKVFLVSYISLLVVLLVFRDVPWSEIINEIRNLGASNG